MDYSATRYQSSAKQGLAQRPAFMRAPVQHAQVVAGSRKLSAMIRSVSPSGIKLDGVFGLAAGDSVTIMLPSQDAVSGTVDWSVGGFCGVTFTQPLADDHPVLSAEM
ncbi:hypothetical protein [Hyphomicrobium sp. 1Nfss2.1]|uniref:hypothetical protein n=1 Tax=Hyphomicrobium sp. 1Nfss2.1 TaxID=3413936 RepID=UPI003C7CD69B